MQEFYQGQQGNAAYTHGGLQCSTYFQCAKVQKFLILVRSTPPVLYGPNMRYKCVGECTSEVVTESKGVRVRAYVEGEEPENRRVQKYGE